MTLKFKYYLQKFSKNLILSLLVFTAQASALDVGNKVVVGNFERIIILPGEISFKAKLDTGAKNSSIHATDVEFFLLNKKDHVRFNTSNTAGESISLELPVARFARIKRHGQESQRRAVVNLGICMGSKYKKVEVTLTDRSKFSFRFLIGTTYLRNKFIVDVSSKYTKVSSCNSIGS